jgi:Uma2 family endonuclease
MVIREQTTTVEQFWEEYAGKPFELINGKVVAMSPAGGTHGAVINRIQFQLRLYIEEHPIGELFGAETGFRFGDDLRGTDAAFVSLERWQTVTEPDKYIPFAPDLAIEVVSPNDVATEVRAKVDLYLTHNTRLVWIIYPAQRQVIVHYPDHTARTFTEDKVLDGGDVMPGLQVPVGKLFPALKKTV